MDSFRQPSTPATPLAQNREFPHPHPHPARPPTLATHPAAPPPGPPPRRRRLPPAAPAAAGPDKPAAHQSPPLLAHLPAPAGGPKQRAGAWHGFAGLGRRWWGELASALALGGRAAARPGPWPADRRTADLEFLSLLRALGLPRALPLRRVVQPWRVGAARHLLTDGCIDLGRAGRLQVGGTGTERNGMGREAHRRTGLPPPPCAHLAIPAHRKLALLDFAACACCAVPGQLADPPWPPRLTGAVQRAGFTSGGRAGRNTSESLSPRSTSPSTAPSCSSSPLNTCSHSKIQV